MVASSVLEFVIVEPPPAVIVAVKLYQAYGTAVPVAIYVAVACLISGISALLARETKGVELKDIR